MIPLDLDLCSYLLRVIIKLDANAKKRSFYDMTCLLVFEHWLLVSVVSVLPPGRTKPPNSQLPSFSLRVYNGDLGRSTAKLNLEKMPS